MRQLKIQSFLLLSFLIIAQSIQAQKPSKASIRYFSKVADIIKKYYYFIDIVNFKKIEINAKRYLVHSTTANEAYPAIDTLLYNLPDHHNYFWRPKINENLNRIFPLQYPTGQFLSDKIAYIKVPYMIGHHDSAKVWADSLRSIYDLYDDNNTKGWIIDLRGNFGGAIHPMLTGLYPFWGDTTILSFQQRNVGSGKFKFVNGFLVETLEEKNVMQFISYKKLNSGVDKRKVAVLIDNKVGSSGEILTIALRNRENTKLFGTQTAGIPTIIRNWTLSDGAYLGIVTGVFFDKLNNPYIHAIKPDVQVSSTNNTELINKAIEWINEK